MKRALLFVSVAVLALGVFASGLPAQSSPFVGTWKLNIAKSKFISGAPPKEQTSTIQTVGDQDQVTVSGTVADGSPISAKYEVPEKGGAGKVLAGGAFDAVSGKRIDANTYETSLMKGGKEMLHIHSAVSKDGKTMTNTTKGTDDQGKPISRVAVWEKQ
jgi:hypothetical protein